MVIAIDATNDEPTEIDGIIMYQSDSVVGKLAQGAVSAIEEALCAFGVAGDKTLRIKNSNILITEIGEAIDMQAIITILFENELYL